ncbi:MAG: PilT/PilU family type 4a pilus ATPase [Acidimicrobiales bacterium]
MSPVPTAARVEWSLRLAQALVNGGYATEANLSPLLTEAQATGQSLATLLIARQVAIPSVVVGTLAQLSQLPAVDLAATTPDPDALSAVGTAGLDFRAVGLRLDGNQIAVAFGEPPSNEEVQALSARVGYRVSPVLADPTVIDALLGGAPGTPPPPVASPGASVPSSVEAPPPPPPGAPILTGSPPPPPPPGAAAAVLADSGLATPPPPPGQPPTRPLGQPAAPVVGGLGVDRGQGPANGTGHSPSQANGTGLTNGNSLTNGNGLTNGTGHSPANGNGHAVGAPVVTGPGSAGVRVSAGEDKPLPLHIDDLLRYAVSVGASDLHLTAQMPGCIRLHGAIRPIEGCPRLDNETIRDMVFGILPASQRERFEEERELDTSHSIAGVGRFRVNVSLQRGTVSAALRPIPHEMPAFESLGIPDSVRSFTELRRGLVLVTGPTGSGKSTTLASLIDIINRTKPLHIVTVEDPIEFLHDHKRSIVNQREIGEDTFSFAEALRRVLRQDPDVILVGELRDLETISTALTAAETGHLVFATLHTQDAPQTVDRIIDVFPTSQQEQIRVMLASTLEGVVTQQLVLNAEGTGRVASCEVLMCTSAVRNLIRSNKTHQIYSLMQTGSVYGMQTMDQGLARLVKEGVITESVAYDRAKSEDDLRNHLNA